MHSLWAASWFADVEGFNRQAVVNQLFTMAIGISLGALLLGILADRLRKRGVATEVLLAAFGALFMLAELALILRVPLPPILPWSVVSMVGAATVLSYAIIADLLSGRNRSACKWCFESLAFRLGVRGSIWNRINRKPMGNPGWALSASRLSSRVRAEPCSPGACSVVVRSAMVQELYQRSPPFIPITARPGRICARDSRGNDP